MCSMVMKKVAFLAYVHSTVKERGSMTLLVVMLTVSITTPISWRGKDVLTSLAKVRHTA